MQFKAISNSIAVLLFSVLLIWYLIILLVIVKQTAKTLLAGLRDPYNLHCQQ